MLWPHSVQCCENIILITYNSIKTICNWRDGFQKLYTLFCLFQVVMLDCDKVLKAPMSLSSLNSMNATLNAMNATLPLNSMNATLPLNSMNVNLTLNANLHVTLNATNASTIEHSSVISTDKKSTSLNAKVVTTKSITSNCINNKLIYDTTVRSRYVKFLCHRNSKNQLIFNGYYQHSNCLSQRCQRDREPSRIPAKKICRLLTKSRKLRKAFRKKIEIYRIHLVFIVTLKLSVMNIREF